MNDLISRNKAIQRFIQETVDSNSNLIHINTAKRLLQDVDTAYSVDKVVEEIKTLKEEALGEYNMGEYNLDNNIGNRISQNYRKDMNEGRCFAYDDAIEIVEQGEIK